MAKGPFQRFKQGEDTPGQPFSPDEIPEIPPVRLFQVTKEVYHHDTDRHETLVFIVEAHEVEIVSNDILRFLKVQTGFQGLPVRVTPKVTKGWVEFEELDSEGIREPSQIVTPNFDDGASQDTPS